MTAFAPGDVARCDVTKYVTWRKGHHRIVCGTHYTKGKLVIETVLHPFGEGSYFAENFTNVTRQRGKGKDQMTLFVAFPFWKEGLSHREIVDYAMGSQRGCILVDHNLDALKQGVIEMTQGHHSDKGIQPPIGYFIMEPHSIGHLLKPVPPVQFTLL